MEGIETTSTQIDKAALFREGMTLIFKKWTSFRISLDHNPHVLSEYADEEKSDLEINQMLNLLYDDITKEMKKESGGVLEMNIADMLFYFVQEFFDVELHDEDEFQVAKSLIKLYNELENNKLEYIERLRAVDKKFNYSNYVIDFPLVMGKNTNISEIEKVFEEKAQIGLEMDVEIEKSNENDKKVNEVDEEGFTTVKKGKNKF